MRLFWLASLGVLTVVMAVMTPYVFRREPVWWAVGWCVMLVGAATMLALFVRIERLLRSDRRPDEGTTETR